MSAETDIITTGYRLFSQHPVEDRITFWALRSMHQAPQFPGSDLAEEISGDSANRTGRATVERGCHQGEPQQSHRGSFF